MVHPPSSRRFGTLPTGESVEAWTLCGAGGESSSKLGGLSLEVITYGGIVTRLMVPDRNGNLADVVLGFNDLDSYVGGHPYFGAITGRVAGRITSARFDLDGSAFELAPNDPPNHLHGGINGFDKKLWKASPTTDENGEPSLQLTYRSKDGEEGYPGNVDITVVYSITADNTFRIATEAVTDQLTPLNLTHHSYFNLAGEGHGSIADHDLQIDADYSIAVDETMTLLGRAVSLDEQRNDFRKPRQLGDALLHLFRSHGDLYLLRRQDSCQTVARLTHAPSGRFLEVSTTETYLQLYLGTALDGSLVGKSGKPYRQYAGVCLECHGYPDGANDPLLGDIVLRPGQIKRQTMEYRFGVIGSGHNF